MRKIEDQFGPVYNVASAKLQKFRSRSRKGLRDLACEDRHAYGAAVEAAVLASQRSFLKSHGEAEPRPNCASRTWHTCGKAISAAMREKHRAALAAYPAKVRRERTPEQWRVMYDEAMQEKRKATQ